jgi:hypothetical protein
METRIDQPIGPPKKLEGILFKEISIHWNHLILAYLFNLLNLVVFYFCIRYGLNFWSEYFKLVPGSATEDFLNPRALATLFLNLALALILFIDIIISLLYIKKKNYKKAMILSLVILILSFVISAISQFSICGNC